MPDDRATNRAGSQGREMEDVPMSVVEFLEEIEGPLKEKHLPKEKKKFIYTSMLGTAKGLRYSFLQLFYILQKVSLPLIRHK
jgi:hypothetical protein